MSATNDIPKSDQDASVQAEVPIDHRYIPVRPEAIARAISQDTNTFGTFAAQAESLLEALSLVIESETAALRHTLDGRYAAFNPDCIELPENEDDLRSPADAEALGDAIRYVFEKANFVRLDDVQIEEAITAANSQGYRVRLDPDAIEHMDLYVRGLGKIERTLRHWRAPIRGRMREFNIYRRLGVALRLKDSDHILLKLFRDIPIADIEALLPHAQIQMSWTDRVRVGFGGAGALGGLALKVAKGGAFIAPTALLIPAAVALGGLSVKSFFGYRRTKHLRASQRIHHLYHQNLASNAAVLHVLLAFVTTQEINEALLLYAHLVEHPQSDEMMNASARHERISRSIGEWLQRHFNALVEFEFDDAMETLDRLDLWDDRSQLAVRDVAAADEVLRARILDHRVCQYHMEQIAARHPQDGRSSSEMIAEPSANHLAKDT